MSMKKCPKWHRCNGGICRLRLSSTANEGRKFLMTLDGRLDYNISIFLGANTQDVRNAALDSCIGLVISGASPVYRHKETGYTIWEAVVSHSHMEAFFLHEFWKAAVLHSHLQTMIFLRRRGAPLSDDIEQFCKNEMVRDIISVWKMDDELTLWNMEEIRGA